MMRGGFWMTLIGLLLGGCSGTTPAGLDVHNGRLAPCPPSPNCVCSQSDDDPQHIAPFTYRGDRSVALLRLKAALATLPRTVLVAERADYLHTTSASLIFRFVDDLEFYLPEDRKVIEVRSAARLGHSDFGVNRRRLEALRAAFNALP